MVSGSVFGQETRPGGHSNSFSGRFSGGRFGQKGGPASQGSTQVQNNELSSIIEGHPEGDPISNRPFLKGKKSLGFSLRPSSHPMESPVEKLKLGGLQANPFQALRGQFEDTPFKDPREVASREEGSIADVEKEGDVVLGIVSPQRASILETLGREAS